MKDFVSIDFETANEHRSSVCSVGLVIVRNGQAVDSIYRLIRPNPNYYNWFTEIHGITDADTCSSPDFPDVWAEIAPKIEGFPLVAHNSPFDERCLRAVHEVYGMNYPHYTFYCTLKAARNVFGTTLPNHKLHTVAERCGYKLENHHHALADAEACSWIARTLL
jgi:DNA polymerase-3 subunit epsilon